MAPEKTNLSLLERWKNSEKKLSSVSIFAAPEGTSIPLSSGQQRLWFLQKLYPDNPFYNTSTGLVFTGNLIPDLLKESLNHIFECNEIFKSSYPLEDGLPVFRYNKNIVIDINEVDFGNLSYEEAGLKANTIISLQAATRFDFSNPPLVKASLIRTSESEHILFLTMHHIIVDLWSVGILKEELAKNYRLLNNGGQLEYTNLEIQYSDYAYWQRNKPVDESQLDYWKEKLSGDLPVLSLPADYKSPSTPSFKGRRHRQVFSEEFSGQILQLAKSLNVTPFVLLFSAYYLLLNRHTAQNDILVGTPVTTRSDTSLERLIGFFIETIVLRVQIEQQLSFSEFLKHVHNNVLEAFSNKDVPFDELVKALKLDRNLSTNPLFQVMFVFDSTPETFDFGDNVQYKTWSELDSEASKFDLTLFVSEQNGILSTTFEYATDLFDETTIDRYQEHLKLILKEVTSNSECKLNEISILTPQEKEFFLQTSKVSDAPFANFNGIHEIIEKRASETPYAIAAIYDENHITYGELIEKATAMVPSILEYTEGRNEIIGLAVDRSLNMVIGLMAILKSGCAYLPIDPDYPTQRIDFMLKDAEVRVMLTSGVLKSKFKNFTGIFVSVDEEKEKKYGFTGAIPEFSEENLAYVIYTSGSTGKPKGVPISHKNIIDSTGGRLTFYKSDPLVFLLMSSFAFDSSKAGIFWTLCTGGTLIISKKHAEQDIQELARVIQDHKVSHTLMLPSLYNMLLQFADSSQIRSLSTIIVAGEACQSSVVKKHFEIMPNVGLYNEYGPTEASVWCIAHKVLEENVNTGIPIGRPVANAQILLLNENAKLVPFGAVGEICIGGPGLSKGYLNRPELTNTAFFDNPFSNIPGKKIYKTGDQGRYNKNGNIEFLGRVDEQVKIRGYRIELDEIENAILQNAKIQDAVVLVEEVAATSVKRLVAFIIQKHGLDSTKLKQELKTVLPDYMVPSLIVEMDVFPTLPNGKIDKRALLATERNTGQKQTKKTSVKENEIQKKLREIWQQVLDIDAIGIEDNFFELGGDSISSIQIIAKARNEGIALKANQLFDHQTIAELSIFAEVQKENIVSKEDLEGELPLTPIQHWFFEVHKAAPHYWNHIMQVSNIENLKYSLIQDTVESLVSYHDALRLSFSNESGGWKASILNTTDLDVFKYFDVSEINELGAQKDKIEDIVKTDQVKCDLKKGNLFRVLYFECGTQHENVVFIIAHHLVVDKVSWNTILGDFSSALSLGSLERKNLFKQKTASIKKWGEHLIELAKSPEIRNELQFWKSQVDNTPLISSNFSSVKSVYEDRSIVLYQCFENQELTHALIYEANEAYHTKIEDLLVTALIMTVCEYTKSERFCLGLERHGRNADNIELDVSNTVGWFTSFFPVSLKYESTAIDQQIKSIKEQLRNIPNAGIGYGILKYLTDLPEIEGTLNQSPQLIFNYLGVRQKNFEQADIVFDPIITGTRDPLSERNYGLEINAIITEKQLCLNWSYSTELYSEPVLKQLVHEYRTNLKKIVDHCLRAEQGSYTPSDFPEADLSQDDLDSIMKRFE